LPDADLAEKAQTIVQQADRMSSIIEHSRMFVRGSQTQVLGPVDLNQAVNSAMSMAGGQLRAHGIDLRLELAPELPPVQANQYSLEEVFLNLVNNARDACLEKEYTGTTPALIIRSAADDGGRRVRVEVEDNGPGIPEEVLPRLFEPFFTTKDVERGTGLGLTIVRSIVENYGGEIAVRSRLGEGTRFSLSLPVTDK
jgi:signal transduction histidine kinase